MEMQIGANDFALPALPFRTSAAATGLGKKRHAKNIQILLIFLLF
jgi:hypothetical protein